MDTRAQTSQEQYCSADFLKTILIIKIKEMLLSLDEQIIKIFVNYIMINYRVNLI